jgi:hypothetical protein
VRAQRSELHYGNYIGGILEDLEWNGLACRATKLKRLPSSTPVAARVEIEGAVRRSLSQTTTTAAAR